MKMQCGEMQCGEMRCGEMRCGAVSSGWDGGSVPDGWHVDEKTGSLLCDTVHHMGRRCRNWDYCAPACYLVTMALLDRSRPVLGRVRRAAGGAACFEPSALGRRVEEHVRRIPAFSSEIEILGFQAMPDHLHVVLRVRRRMAKPLGEHLRRFKIGCTKLLRAIDGAPQKPAAPSASLARSAAYAAPSRQPASLARFAAYAASSRQPASLARPAALFADGFVDTILFDAEAVARALAYVADNPRRLLEKREHAEYFRVARDLALRSPIDGRAMHFSAIGNRHLLEAPSLVQVQCSRRDFAYAKDSLPCKFVAPVARLSSPPRDAGGLGASAACQSLRPRIDARAAPAVCTPAFEEKAADLLAAGAHGAVLVSPCISHGEKEIARRALSSGARLIVLSNKGFSPLWKPSGLYFDRCAEGRLLVMAPAGWPYLPGKKAMTRHDACALNRIAQLLCGSGAAKIDYKGVTPLALDRLVEEATKPAKQVSGG